MIDLKNIENEINVLSEQLRQKRNEYERAKKSNLKEQYGNNFGCGNCAYSCCVDVGDRCTCCTKLRCIYCNDYCEEYMPENELSAYIRDKHYYDEYTVSNLNKFFGVIDIMQKPKLHQIALKVLMLRDNKEYQHETQQQ